MALERDVRRHAVTLACHVEAGRIAGPSSPSSAGECQTQIPIQDFCEDGAHEWANERRSVESGFLRILPYCNTIGAMVALQMAHQVRAGCCRRLAVALPMWLSP